MSEPLTPAEAPVEAPPVEAPVTPPVETPVEPTLPGDGSLLAEAAPAAEVPPEGAATATAPEAYAEFTLPEGLTVEPELMGAFQEQAKTLGLSQEAAQSMVDLYGKTVQSQVEAAAKQLADASTQAWKDVNTQWLSELETVPDFQGDNKKASLQIVAKALEEYGVGDVRQAFALTGAGNNPAIVQTFLKMARALSEGTLVASGSPATGPQTSGQILYGDTAAKGT